MKLEHTLEIQASPEIVWSWLADPEKQRQWMTGFVSNKVVEGDGASAGSVFEMEVKEGRSITTYRGTLHTFDPPREMGIHLVGGCLDPNQLMEVRYLLEPVGSGTRLSYATEGEMKGCMVTMFGWLFRLMGKRFVKKMFDRLKAGAEAEARAV